MLLVAIPFRLHLLSAAGRSSAPAYCRFEDLAGKTKLHELGFDGHCQSKFYTACSPTRAGGSSTVFAHELPPRSAGLDAESRLYLFALTVPNFDICRLTAPT